MWQHQLLQHPPDLGPIPAIAAAGAHTSSTLHQSNTQPDAKSNTEDDEYRDTRANPFQLATAAGVVGGLVDLLVAILKTIDGSLSLLFGAFNRNLLLDDHGVQVPHQSGEFFDGLLDVQQLIVPRAHTAEYGGSLACAIAPQLDIK